jgi:hypothetical protein
VPQKPYKSLYPGMHDRVAVRHGATTTVTFGSVGVRVTDALAGKLDGMERKDEKVLDDVQAKTNSVRIWVLASSLVLRPTFADIPPTHSGLVIRNAGAATSTARAP